MSWLTKKLWENVLLIAIFVLTFVAGILFNPNLILSILFLLISIYLQIKREKLQSNIKGDGVKEITVSDKKPLYPENGDLWVDTK